MENVVSIDHKLLTPQSNFIVKLKLHGENVANSVYDPVCSLLFIRYRQLFTLLIFKLLSTNIWSPLQGKLAVRPHKNRLDMETWS
jgi:hypothetical protein